MPAYGSANQDENKIQLDMIVFGNWLFSPTQFFHETIIVLNNGLNNYSQPIFPMIDFKIVVIKLHFEHLLENFKIMPS